MFLINTQLKELKRYSVELKSGSPTTVTTLEDFYSRPEEVSSFTFPGGPDESDQTQDERIRPVYEFIAKLAGISIGKRKSNIVRITTDQDYTKFSGPQLDAFVNLGDPCELSFYKKEEISDLIPEVTDSTEPPADDDPARMPDDDKVFTTDVLQDNIFTLNLDYNELVIYDPTIMVFRGDMTKYQSFSLT